MAGTLYPESPLGTLLPNSENFFEQVYMMIVYIYICTIITPLKPVVSIIVVVVVVEVHRER